MPDTKTHTGLTALMKPRKPDRPKARWRRATLTSLSAVEGLLDALENSGCAERWLTVAGDVFVVRWR